MVFLIRRELENTMDLLVGSVLSIVFADIWCESISNDTFFEQATEVVDFQMDFLVLWKLREE